MVVSYSTSPGQARGEKIDEHVQREIMNHRSLKHPNIVRFKELWHNHLNPNISKEAWTQEAELTLISAHQIYGNKWAELTKFLPGSDEEEEDIDQDWTDGGDDEVVMSSTAKAREHKKLRVCVDSAMELMNEVVLEVSHFSQEVFRFVYKRRQAEGWKMREAELESSSKEQRKVIKIK
ncbi:unnamed protein product [Camellia sinensis]